MSNNNLKFQKVVEAMTHNPFTVKQHTLLSEVKTLFDREAIHHLPVVDDNGYLLGIMSKSDLLLLLDWGTKFNLKSSELINEKLLNSNTALEICTQNFISVKTDDTLQTCFELFRENYFRSLPVLNDDNKLVGIITPFDLMNAAFQ